MSSSVEVASIRSNRRIFSRAIKCCMSHPFCCAEPFLLITLVRAESNISQLDRGISLGLAPREMWGQLLYPERLDCRRWRFFEQLHRYGDGRAGWFEARQLFRIGLRLRTAPTDFEPLGPLQR